MDSTGDDSPAPEETDSEPKAPKFGCIMFSLIFAFFTGAMVFAIVQGGRMYSEIVAFTDEQPIEIPEERGTPEELSRIRDKVTTFIEAMTPENPAPTELALNAHELNLLIANDNYLTDIRGRFFIDSISDDGLIRTRVSRPRRHLVFWKPQRYLNGEVDLQVEAAEGQFFLRVADVRVADRTIDPGVLEYMRTEDLLEMYKNDERFEEIVKKINSARVINGTLIVSTEEATPETSDTPKTP